ncbi:MAG: putative transcriptional regulator, Crp/Fnr family [Myxococcales bacterium]|nr:putative transcriptional regulator, Crp/Fnr family [Myxococcales bacterium]
MAKVDLRKLKDLATKAVEKKQYGKAAELYLQICENEPGEPDWRQRAGEAFRKLPDGPKAVQQMEKAAEGYAKGGFLLKAIAVCKVVLQIDPKHTTTQAMLADLYARREGRAPAGRVNLAGESELGRTASGQFTMMPKAPAATTYAPTPAATAYAPPAARPPAPPARAIAPPPVFVADDISEPALGLVADAEVVSIDDRRRGITPSQLAPVAMVAPLDALPLHQMLGGRRSQQFSAIDVTKSGAYEISLDDADLSLEDAVAIEIAAEPEEAAPAATDELDFSGVLEDAAAKVAPPRPAPPPRSAPPPPPDAAPGLPKIPLLSSLNADDLRYVIEHVAMRECEPGDVIVRQGEEGGSLFVIVSGRVQVVAEGPPRRELASLSDGAFFGELALLTNFPRSATIIAAEPTQLLEISRELTAEIMQRSPDVLKTLLRFFRDRLLDRLLSSSPMFSSFSPEEARGLADRFLFLELEPGMRVIVEGERAPGLFLLLCGDARVMRGHTEQARLSPGDIFGEMSLLTRGPASATIVAHTKCWTLELPRDRFQEIMLTYPQMLEYVSDLADKRKQQNLAGSESRVDFL